MFRNYFKVAIRNLWRNKGFSFINIFGLAIGMASAVLILLWIGNEVSYDRFHSKGDRLYEVWGSSISDGKLGSSIVTPQLLGPTLKKDYPEIEATTRIGWPGGVLFAYGDKIIKANGTWADPAFLTMFDFPLIKGDPKTALNDPYSVVITEKMAKKLFGDADPIGKPLKFDNSENFTVTGVMKNLPDNTMFDFEFLNSSEFLNAKNYIDKDWTDVSIRTFALLTPNASLDEVNKKIRNIVPKYSNNRSKDLTFLYPVSRMRLYSDFEDGKPVGGRISSVRLFGIIAAFILLIACINFMNLATARGEKRAKEVGIRKVTGALRRSLIGQFLGESILIAVLAGIIALITVQLTLPAFNNLTGKQLAVDYGNIYFWLAALGFVGITGALAGSYPAFFLSSFKPAAVLKGSFKKIKAPLSPRRVLVVLQFTIAIALMICTIIVEKQIKYAQTRKTGYDKNNLLYVSLEGDIMKNYGLIKNDLINSGAASSVCQTLSPLTQIWSAGMSLNWEGKDPTTRPFFIRSSTDGGLVKTAGLHLVAGRDIDPKNFPSDSTACLINEAAANIMGLRNPVGADIFDTPDHWHVVGILKDFVLETPYQAIKPIIFKGPKYDRGVMYIKLNDAQSTVQNIAVAEKIFKKYNPAYPFEYHFMDEEYAKKFTDEQLIGKLAFLFAGLTILISCLGLFGLATFMAETRIKEIGVRKVLGASIVNITGLLSKDFLRLVFISILIAIPVAWWAMNKWLESYNYRTEISWWVFLLAGSTALLIALITICFQTIKAALANPVKSLRTE